MESYLVYIGKSALAAGAFYLAYLLLFQTRKQFVFNRFYLPVSLAISFAIPLITFTTIQYIEPIAPVNHDLTSFAYLPEATQISEPEFVYQWYHYLFGIYLLGAAGFLFHLLLGHFKAAKIIRFSRLKQLFGAEVNITPKDIHPFSFFKNIVVSEKTLGNPNLKMIVEHEMVHVKERHTFDILLAEILFLLQWFNPFAWLIKDEIRNNLEYKTDNEIIKSNNAEAYQLAMVGLADKKGVAPFLTALNGSQLKNRIVMMKKKTENKFVLIKQILVLPLLAVLVMGLSNREVKTEIVSGENSDKGTSPFQVKEKVSDLESPTPGSHSPKITGNILVEPPNEIQNESSKAKKIIKGKVTNEKGEPVSGASVLIKGKPIGTITDPSGNYEIRLEEENTTLLFLMRGYLTKEIKTDNNTEINVKLEVNNLATSGVQPTSGPPQVISIIETNEGNATKHTIKGKVTNENGKALPAASIIIKGKTIGTVTDSYGNYELRLEEKDETIIISMAGYEKKEVNVDGKAEINVKLKVDKNHKTVVGYSTLSQFSANNNSINLSNIENSPNQPLYIIDGKIIESIEDISPADIESISVLKGASAIALYGEKGKDGVILVKTKGSKQLVKGELPIVLNGKMTELTLKEVDSDLLQNVKRIEPDEAVKKYGSKGKNGVFEVTTRQMIDENSTLQTEKITTQLELRKFIADKIIYPEKAKFGKEGIAQLFVKMDKNGIVTDILEKSTDKNLFLDEVVVVGNKPDQQEVIVSRKYEDLSNIFVDETKRVINLFPTLEIPEFKGRTVAITVKFILQD
ncbi:MAG: carboxypeptidase-like regulatory domain-containing protein [Bacteroidota bacterium]